VFAATRGLKTFDQYTDPETGKEGKTNVSVTVGKYRGNKLVSVLHTAELQHLSLSREPMLGLLYAYVQVHVHTAMLHGCMCDQQLVCEQHDYRAQHAMVATPRYLTPLRSFVLCPGNGCSQSTASLHQP